jgi:hypothetical protein
MAKLRTYKAYVFKGEKDPVIAQIRGMAEDYYGVTKLTGKELAQNSKDGGPSNTCMRAWFYGETKRPQNTTIEAAGRAMGFERVWRKMRRNQPGE